MGRPAPGTGFHSGALKRRETRWPLAQELAFGEARRMSPDTRCLSIPGLTLGTPPKWPCPCSHTTLLSALGSLAPCGCQGPRPPRSELVVGPLPLSLCTGGCSASTETPQPSTHTGKLASCSRRRRDLCPAVAWPRAACRPPAYCPSTKGAQRPRASGSFYRPKGSAQQPVFQNETRNPV